MTQCLSTHPAGGGGGGGASLINKGLTRADLSYLKLLSLSAGRVTASQCWRKDDVMEEITDHTSH